MKKVLLTAAALFAFGFANAQDATTTEEAKPFGFSKGNIFLEGQLSFNSNKETNSALGTTTDEVKSSEFTFTPKVGYFISDKFAVGVELGVMSGKETTTDFTVVPTDVTEQKMNGFGAGVFARYYFLELGQRFKTYTEFGMGFASSKTDVDGIETEKTNSFGAGLDLGMNYFITKRFAISFGLSNVLSFNSSKTKMPLGAESKSNEFNGDLNVFNNFFDTPTFGLVYKF